MTNKEGFAVKDGILTKYTGPGGNIVIPSGVRAVGQGVFLNFIAMRSLTLPEGVEEIRGDFFSESPTGAFSGCSNLNSVQLPQSLREIGCWAFAGCKALKSLEIPSGVSKIGNRAFQNCESLRSVTIPNGIREIDYGVFMGCKNLLTVDLPAEATVIREYAFADCASLSRVDLPRTVKTIDYCAFRNCTSLTSVTIPADTKEIADYAFENCTGLLSVSIPDGVEVIGENAFRGCPRLVVRARTGSRAEQYARKRDIPVVTHEQLKDAARSMLGRAYVPYSHFPVGAALECEDGTVFTGCNVENAVYPAGICAERNAVFHAVAEGRLRFTRIVIAGKGRDFCMPCGICRQVMAEFSPDMEVISLNGDGQEKTYTLRELLPHSFGPHSLKTN
ncbi:MAG: cytidine deaminase [Oscillospiraceae bacterium]|nr:cytidine deaminase [Oscillospiraceae bacterium]